MDYDGAIESTYKWIFRRTALLYLLFFSAVLFVVFLVQGLDTVFWGSALFSQQALAALMDLYYVVQVLFFVGIVYLLGVCLKSAGFQTVKISFSRILDVFFLQIVELWCLFVWSMSKRYRLIQFLSLLGMILSVFTFSVTGSFAVGLSLVFLSAVYLSCVAYNSVRLLFSTLILLNRGVGIRGALNGSWSLTHQRFGGLFPVFCVVLVFLFFLCAIASFLGSAIANIVLLSVGFHSFFGGTSLSDLELARVFGTAFGVSVFVVGYCFSVTRMYSQAVKHQDSSNKIRRILSWRVLYPKKPFSKHSAKVPLRRSKRLKRKKK